MQQDLDNPSAGLVEGIGMELHPYSQETSGQSGGPMQPQSGQWTLRFNYTDITTLSVFVTVSFGPPFAPTAELSADMDKSQVQSLRDWLTSILTAMGPPSSPP